MVGRGKAGHGKARFLIKGEFIEFIAAGGGKAQWGKALSGEVRRGSVRHCKARLTF